MIPETFNFELVSDNDVKKEIENLHAKKSSSYGSIPGSILTLFRTGLLVAALMDEGEGGGKKAPILKICHTYPTIMKLGTFIPYLKKTQEIYESRDTSLEFYRHQHFFIGNWQI